MAAAAAAGIAVAAIGPGTSRTSLAGWSVAVRGSDVRIQTAKLSGQSHLQGTISPAGLPVIVRMNPPGGGQNCAHPHLDIAEKATATTGDGSYTGGEGHVQVHFDLIPSVIPAGDAVEFTIITSFDPAGPLPSVASAALSEQLVKADGSCLPS